MNKKKRGQAAHRLKKFNVAGATGIEPAASSVTGMRSNQIDLRPQKQCQGWESNPRPTAYESVALTI